MEWIIILIACLIIGCLAFYAGQLLSKLKKQNERRQRAREFRLKNINESIQTIAFAMQQQQCNLSEGAIRIFKILESVPIVPLPDYSNDYPSLHKLYTNVKDLPTHQDRNKLTKEERRSQDRNREQIESELESKILDELESLRILSIK